MSSNPPHKDKLKLVFAESPESNDHEVRPFAGEVDILTVAPGGPYLGLDPPEFFRQPQLLKGGELLAGRCDCGVVGCGDSWAKVELSDESVVWTFSGKMRFEYDRADYLKTIREGAADTSWESLERTVERLVEGLDFSARENLGYKFQWASARYARGRITLSFLKDGQQRLFDVGWNQVDPEDALERVRQWLQQPA